MSAALIAQESTFVADIKSSANACGLMQLMPSTGRQYAQNAEPEAVLAAPADDPEANIRIGTAYLAAKIW